MKRRFLNPCIAKIGLVSSIAYCPAVFFLFITLMFVLKYSRQKVRPTTAANYLNYLYQWGHICPYTLLMLC